MVCGVAWLVKCLHNVRIKSSIQSSATYALIPRDILPISENRKEDPELKVILENIVSFEGRGSKGKREREKTNC